jgi:hypothetical protein
METTYFTDFDGKEHAVITHTDGSTTTMLKSTYDAMQAEQSTPSVIDAVSTK